MKLIAALIATVAAIKNDAMQMYGGLDIELPTPSLAVAAIADTPVADASTIAAIGDLSEKEALELAIFCTINEDWCASNFEEVVMEACWADEPAEGCDAIDRMFDGLDARFEEMFGDLSEGSWLDSEAGSGGSGAEWSEWESGEGSGYGSGEGSGYGSDADSGDDYGTTDMEEWCAAYGCDTEDYGDYGNTSDYGDYGTTDMEEYCAAYGCDTEDYADYGGSGDDYDYGTVDFA